MSLGVGALRLVELVNAQHEGGIRSNLAAPATVTKKRLSAILTNHNLLEYDLPGYDQLQRGQGNKNITKLTK